MALRVLLADESTTIKKVMQLALQDYGVDVKSVPVGSDALEVARAFKPDLVFADVLLQKRNGYEVCSDLKRDAELAGIPVVLMWSSFMELDESAYAGCGANGRLEKPFDVDSLRGLVSELVPKTSESKIAEYLRYPTAIAEPLEREESARKERASSAGVAPTAPAPIKIPPSQPATAPPPPSVPPPRAPSPFATPVSAPVSMPPTKPPTQAPADSAWSMETFEDIASFGDDDGEVESFSQVKLTAVPNPSPASAPPAREKEEDIEPWSHQDLSRFRVDVPPVEVDSEELSLLVRLDEPVDGSFLLNVETRAPGPPAPIPKATKPQPTEVKEDFEAEYLNSETIEMPAMTDLESESLEVMPVEDFKTAGSIDGPITGTNMSADQLEAIIRAQSREIIESVVRRIVPDLASQMIKRELERLLAETGESAP